MDKKKHSKFVKNRIIKTAFILSVIIFGFIVRVGYLQIVKGESLSKKASHQWTRDIVLKPDRGDIYDRNGKKLSTDVSLYSVSVIPSKISEEKHKIYADKISTILDIDIEEVEKALNADGNWSEVERYVDIKKAEKLKEEKLIGVSIDEETKRYYPFDNFLAQVIGNTNRDSVGQYGIEKEFNETLMGTPGRWIKTVDGNRMELPYNYQKKYEPENGNNIVLTIDEKIQHFSETEAEKALIENKAKRVSTLVMDPKTGEMLAMASKPDYNPNNRMSLDYDIDSPWDDVGDDFKRKFEEKSWKSKEHTLYEIWKNPMVSEIYEPGSTFKLLIAAATLEEGLADTSEKFFCDSKVNQIPGNITCLKAHGEQTLEEGLKNSCNEVAVELGLRLGKEKIVEYARAFGMGDLTGIDLPSEIGGLVKNEKTMSDIDVATMAFGQGIAVTPIQLITSISSIANEGKMMEPNIVKSVIDNEGEVVESKEQGYKRQVISKKTAKTILDIMEEVVADGSGKNAYIEGYRVGGKTGTSQKAIDGKYVNGKHVASFVGVAPVDNPRLIVLTIIDEPSGNVHYGGAIAAPVTKNIIENSLDYLNIPKLDVKEDSKEIKGEDSKDKVNVGENLKSED